MKRTLIALLLAASIASCATTSLKRIQHQRKQTIEYRQGFKTRGLR